MRSAADVVDLEPAVVTSVQNRNGYVAIVFSKQPAYSRGVGEDPRVVPLYDCEIRVFGASIVQLDTELPYKTDDWELKFDGGSRSCFLPVAFEASGPVRLRLGPSEAPQIVVSGTRVELHLGEQIGTAELRAAT